MPKPGPRPYECVRKAWHSDRHQPIRGSLIQEIFRIVNEIHGSATKKNKEWQEKLPIVVLRAEEIMYSKANSEAEYMDVKTVWDRLNDAIDTIIRRDDTTESESESRDLLQPCIEAALHLGCSPKRSSRSQRNISPRYYLTPVNQEFNSVPTGNLLDKSRRNHIPNSPFFSKDHKFISASVKNSNPSGSESNKVFPFSTLEFPTSASIRTLPMQTARASPNTCSMYPLYYGCLPSDPKFGSRSDANSNAQLLDENKKIVPRNNLSCSVKASSRTPGADCEEVPENQAVIGCDLSLRLGSLVVPCTTVENTSPEENKAGDICNRLNDLPPQFNKSLSFFLKENADKNQLESASRTMCSNGQNLNVKPVLVKRKMVEDQQVYWPVKLPFNKFRS